ncbi:MAG TPA: hypothetical protein VIN59_04645 [Alphaproteobacteria bacterium]
MLKSLFNTKSRFIDLNGFAVSAKGYSLRTLFQSVALAPSTLVGLSFGAMHAAQFALHGLPTSVVTGAFVGDAMLTMWGTLLAMTMQNKISLEKRMPLKNVVINTQGETAPQTSLDAHIGIRNAVRDHFNHCRRFQRFSAVSAIFFVALPFMSGDEFNYMSAAFMTPFFLHYDASMKRMQSIMQKKDFMLWSQEEMKATSPAPGQP